MEENKLQLVKEAFQAKETLTDEEWEHLVEEIKDIIVEGVVNVRERVIETKWQLGDCLFRYAPKLTNNILQRVAEETHLKERELRNCLAFRKRFASLKEMWDTVPEGKNISWHKLCNNYIDFSLPKPVLPVEEKYDDFGLCSWWIKQTNVKELHLKDKSSPLILIVREARLKPEEYIPLKQLYEDIIKVFIDLKRWDRNDLDRGDYARMHKAIKQLLDKAKGDAEKVKSAIKWCHKKYQGSEIDWTLETVVKKYADAVRPVQSYEKYLKKPRS